MEDKDLQEIYNSLNLPINTIDEVLVKLEERAKRYKEQYDHLDNLYNQLRSLQSELALSSTFGHLKLK